MTRRSTLAGLLIVSGLALCGISARHYVRGWQAQREGARVLEAKMSSGSLERTEAETAAAPTEREVPRTGVPSGYPYGEPIARLKIPIARIDAVVFGGADAPVLEKGPGHVPGTELPGHPGGTHNCVITGHRDSHFRNLGWLRPGHEIELDAPGSVERYRVVSREIVMPSTVSVLRPTPKERLTLITCYPFNWVGPAPKRLVVVAEPVSPRRS